MAPTPTGEASSSSAAAPSSRRRLTFLGLPHETQKEIFSHCLRNDLITLSLVSKHFRALAAAHLYRNFVIILPDENDPGHSNFIRRLARGLDTFVTSDYNYAQHLHNVHIDTLVGSPQAELAYKSQLSSLGSRRFLNTLLQLALRKATSLEVFRWNIRVELSPPVWHTLHSIDTLRKFSIRLQDGPSDYEASPPLPLTTSSLSSMPLSVFDEVYDQGASEVIVPVGGFVMPTQTVSGFFVPPQSNGVPPSKPSNTKSPKKLPITKKLPALSGLKNLRELSILDIEGLIVVGEIQSCVRNSAGTLNKLSLSFSDTQGALARKPPPEPVEEDSDIDDEFQAMPASHDEASAPAQAFRAKEARRAQEGILGLIFDLEPIVKKSITPKAKLLKWPIKRPTSDEFAIGLKRVASLLMFTASGSKNLSPMQQQVLDSLDEVAKKYIEATIAASKDAKALSNGEGSSNSATKAKTDTEDAAQPSTGVSGGSLKTKEGPGDANPEDIRVEEPEEQLSLDFMDSASAEAPESGSMTEAKPSTNAANEPPQASSAPASQVHPTVFNATEQRLNLNRLLERLERSEIRVNELSSEIRHLRLSKDANTPASLARIDVADKEKRQASATSHEIKKEIEVIVAEIRDVDKQMAAAKASSADDAESRSRRITDYIRSTRGLALRTLRIYLIPVKASVLLRAIDLRTLRSLTLLNVGNQTPIWNMLARENRAEPLPLRKIFTDNVQAPFLGLTAQLPELHELYMLERDANYRPESFAPKTTITIEHIRKTVLEAHARTLKRIMIKNQADQSWDADEETVQLLCQRGANLLELAVSMNLKTIHVLLQRLTGLVSLRALLIISLRNDDTCMWVMRETRRFLVDILSHTPEMKLRWVSIDDGDKVDWVVRRPAEDEARGAGGGKAPRPKGKAPMDAAATIKAAVMAVAPAIGDDGKSSFANGIFPTLADAEWDLDEDEVMDDYLSPADDDDDKSDDESDDESESDDNAGFNIQGGDYEDSSSSGDEADGEGNGAAGSGSGSGSGGGGKALKCDVEVRRFSDARDIKIFRKEIVAGKL